MFPEHSLKCQVGFGIQVSHVFLFVCCLTITKLVIKIELRKDTSFVPAVNCFPVGVLFSRARIINLRSAIRRVTFGM